MAPLVLTIAPTVIALWLFAVGIPPMAPIERRETFEAYIQRIDDGTALMNWGASAVTGLPDAGPTFAAQPRPGTHLALPA